jgi:hypothetical protein
MKTLDLDLRMPKGRARASPRTYRSARPDAGKYVLEVELHGHVDGIPIADSRGAS